MNIYSKRISLDNNIKDQSHRFVSFKIYLYMVVVRGNTMYLSGNTNTQTLRFDDAKSLMTLNPRWCILLTVLRRLSRC